VLADARRDLVPLGRAGAIDPVIAGPLSDAGATSHHAVARVLPHLDAEATVAVIGIGGLGVYIVQLLRALSEARILAVDLAESRLDTARRYGAADAFVGVDRSTAKSLRAASDGGVDVVIDVVGTDETMAAGIAAMRPGGAFALVGAAGGALAAPWFSTLPREADIFTFQGSCRSDVEAVVALAEAGKIEIPVQRFSLDDAASAYAALDAGTLTGRAIVVPWDV
jgi:propanol-preferring alcohol dehydrogenase